MGRKPVKRTASQEAAHQAELKRKKADCEKKRRSNMSEEQKQAEKSRLQGRRSNLSEVEKSRENERLSNHMQNIRRPKNQLAAGGKEIDDDSPQHYLGPMNLECTHCSSKHFENEKVSNKGLSFSLCCQHGNS